MYRSFFSVICDFLLWLGDASDVNDLQFRGKNYEIYVNLLKRWKDCINRMVEDRWPKTEWNCKFEWQRLRGRWRICWKKKTLRPMKALNWRWIKISGLTEYSLTHESVTYCLKRTFDLSSVYVFNLKIKEIKGHTLHKGKKLIKVVSTNQFLEFSAA